MYIYSYTYLYTYIIYIYIENSLLSSVVFLLDPSYFQEMAFVDSPEVHHKSKVWHHNDTIYCHDPIKKAVRVQTGCQYGGIHHLRCSSIFVQTPQNHQVISAQTDSARFLFRNIHPVFKKTLASTSSPSFEFFKYLNQPNGNQNVPQAGLGHIGDVHRVVHQADAGGSTALRGTGAGEDGQVRGPQLRIPDSGGEKPPLYPAQPKQTPGKNGKKTIQIKKGGSELFGRVMFICCLPFFSWKKKHEFDHIFCSPQRCVAFPSLFPRSAGQNIPWWPRCRRAVFSGSVAEVASTGRISKATRGGRLPAEMKFFLPLEFRDIF